MQKIKHDYVLFSGYQIVFREVNCYGAAERTDGKLGCLWRLLSALKFNIPFKLSEYVATAIIIQSKEKR